MGLLLHALSEHDLSFPSSLKRTTWWSPNCAHPMKAFRGHALGKCSYPLSFSQGEALCGFLQRALSEHHPRSNHTIVLVCALSELRKPHNASHLPSPHHRRPVVMYHQPFIADQFEEVGGKNLSVLRFVGLLGGETFNANDPGHVAGHLYHHIG